MAIEYQGLDVGACSSASDNSAKQFYAVELTADLTVDVTNSAGDKVFGILQNAPKAGDSANVRMSGVTKWKASATIAFGDTVGCANDGRAVAKTADGDFYNGICIKGAAVNEFAVVALGGPMMRGA